MKDVSVANTLLVNHVYNKTFFIQNTLLVLSRNTFSLLNTVFSFYGHIISINQVFTGYIGIYPVSTMKVLQNTANAIQTEYTDSALYVPYGRKVS